MTPRDFIYWLQGYFELSDANTMTPAQVKIVKDHIALILKKETPATPPLTFGGGMGIGVNPQYTWPQGVQASC